MKNYIYILLAVFVSLNLQATTKDQILGDTQKEREIRWVWKYLREFTQSCFESGSECADLEVKKVVRDLNTYLPYFDDSGEKNWNDLLQFVSEKKNPDLFKSDQGETHRLAVTEIKKYSKVYINLDRMDISTQNWVGVLIHEAVHHLGIDDDSSRTPDKIGAEIASHFQKRVQVIGLAQYKREDFVNLIFNSKAAERATVGFMSWQQNTLDVDWTKDTVMQPICQMGEKLTREFVGSPSWRLNRLSSKSGIVTVRGGGFVNVECQNLNSGSKAVKRFLIGAGINLKYALPFKKDSVMNECPEITTDQLEIGPSLDPSDSIGGPNQSFWITEMKNESQILAPTNIWKSHIVVKSVDGYQPKTCEVYFTASKWAFWKQTNMQAPAIFDHCNLKQIDSTTWQIDADFTFPADMQSDNFFITLIRFPDSPGDRFAIPISPDFVGVNNAQAAKPAEIIKVQTVEALAPATSFSNQTLKNSYTVAANEKFTLKILIEGKQSLSELMVDLDFWMPTKQGYQMLAYNGRVSEISQIFTGTKLTSAANGSEVLLSITMPRQLTQYPIAAMKIRRLFMKTSDFSWVEFETNDLTDFVFVKK